MATTDYYEFDRETQPEIEARAMDIARSIKTREAEQK